MTINVVEGTGRRAACRAPTAPCPTARPEAASDCPGKSTKHGMGVNLFYMQWESSFSNLDSRRAVLCCAVLYTQYLRVLGADQGADRIPNRRVWRTIE